jgi:RNA polymerase sigma factor (sigma-70 family)
MEENIWQKYKIIKGTTEGVELKKKITESNIGLIGFVLNRLIKEGQLYGLENIDYEDLVQATVPGLMEAIDKFEVDKGNKFSTFAFACIKNNLLNELRYQRKLKKIPKSSSNNSNTDVLEEIIANEEKNGVKNAINGLPVLEKMIINLIENGATQADISRMMNWDTQYVSAIYSNAMNILRNQCCDE